MTTPDHHVLIVGGGFAGIGMAIRLRGGCSSWYLDPNGRNVTLWPSFTFQYRAATAKFDRHNYDAVPAVEHAATPEEVAA